MSFTLRVCALYSLVGVASAVGMASAWALYSPQHHEAEAHAQRGLAYARQGNLEQAEEELRQATVLAPNDSEALALLGTVLAMERKLAESNEAFKKVLAINANDGTSRRYLAANLWQLHRYGEAKQNLTILLRQQPDDKDARLLLGMVSENTADYATAIRMLASMPEEVGKQAEAIAALARSYYHLQQTEKARATLGRLAGPQAELLGVQIADEMHDFDTARNLLASVEKVSSDRSTLEFRKALVEYHAGEFTQSQHILQNLMGSGGGNAAALNLLGWCYQKQGQTGAAVHAFEESIKLAPEEETTYLDLSKVLLAERRLPAAFEVAKQTTNRFPNSAAAFELRGSAELQMSQFTDAIQSFRQCIDLDPSRPGGIIGLAQAQFAAGLTKEANASFESGIKRFPKNPRLQAGYAVVLLKESESGSPLEEVRAEKLLATALALDDSIEEAHYQLGNLALKKGRVLEAQQRLERALKLNPKNAQAHFALSRVYRRLGRNEDAGREMHLYEESKNAPSPQRSNTDARE